MLKEQMPATQKESVHAVGEIAPKSFPIVEDEKVYYFDSKPNLREGEIVHYMQGVGSQEKWNRFIMSKTIAGLQYIFSFSQTFGGAYQLSFKTHEYEFAATNLDEVARDELFTTISAFVESASGYLHDAAKEIRISPAGASYSADEIRQCIDAILASPKNTLTREEITSDYKGFEIFDLYQKLSGKDFHPTHYNWKSKARARSRLFKMMGKKYFPNWETVPELSSDTDFVLRRKEQIEEGPPN